jgi:outer membrane protein assembly factor BamB
MNDGVGAGYGRLHALNACAPTEPDRVRWIADIPSSSGGSGAFGAATVTGGIVFVGTDQGHVVVLGDPSVTPAAGTRCSNVDYTTASACTAAGYSLVPIPKTLANVPVPDGGNLVAIRNEPVLAEGRVFVGTAKGHVYMLQP